MFTLLTRLAVRRWPLVLLAAALWAALGARALVSLPIEAFPDVTNPMVEVVGVYPGQAAEEVERRVTLELERSFAGTPGLVDLRSVSVFGLALVTLTFADGASDFELRTLVADRLRAADLPDGAHAEMGPQATPVGQIFRYTLAGPRGLKELRAVQDFVVERRLRAVPGVADVVTFGGFERQFHVRLDLTRLAAAGVSVADVHAALARSNTNAGGGHVGIGSQEFVVRGLGAIGSPAELGLTVVREVDGVPIYLRDVAALVDGATPRRGSVGRGGSDDVVEGIVLLRRGENPSEVLAALHARIDELNAGELPAGVRLVTFHDRTWLVDATLGTVGKNLAEGALLVLAVVYLFLRTLRGVLVIAAVIPLSLLTAFVGLRWLGLPANLISLGAIDFGILVDGAIVVLEATLHAIHRAPDRERGAVIEAAAGGVARAVALALLIIVAALLPIFALERVEGRIFAPMAYTYAFALLGALLGALLVVPALERALLRGPVRGDPPRWLAWLGERYAAALARAQRLGRAAGVALLAAGVGLAVYARDIGSEFLPELNEGGFYITAVFPSTIALDETRRHVGVMRARLREVPEVTDVLSHVGRPEDATQAEGPNNAELFVNLAPEASWRPGLTRRALEQQLRARLADTPGVALNFSQPITDRVFETISGVIGQVVVKVRGHDLEAMTTAAEAIRARLAAVDGVADLALYQAGSAPQLRITLDRDALARRGLGVEDVQTTLRVALGNAVATEVWDGERRHGVAVRLPDELRADPEALRRLVVSDPRDAVTLGEVADIGLAPGRASIWREDFTRFVAVKFNVRGRDLGGTVADAQAALHGLELPEATRVVWTGEFMNQSRAMRRLGVALPLALLVILAILYANFRRLRPTLVIAAFLPVAALAAVAGLRAAGELFSVSGAVGCIALLGQVVLSGVVLCGAIDRAAAVDAAGAHLRGAREALRPVLLTTALALLGLMPAATSRAMGSETQRPFAIAIVAGLLIVTPLVLLLLPVLYRGPAARRAP